LKLHFKSTAEAEANFNYSNYAVKVIGAFDDVESHTAIAMDFYKIKN
jgi:hypothetical protein